MNIQEFEDLKIVDLCVEKSKNSKNNALRQIYLELSSNAPREWINQFNEQRKSPRHSMWRKAWIEGKYIVIECVPEEIEQYHLPYLKEDVANSNRKYREHIEYSTREKERRKMENEIKMRNELDRLNALKEKLNFD